MSEELQLARMRAIMSDHEGDSFTYDDVAKKIGLEGDPNAVDNEIDRWYYYMQDNEGLHALRDGWDVRGSDPAEWAQIYKMRAGKGIETEGLGPVPGTAEGRYKYGIAAVGKRHNRQHNATYGSDNWIHRSVDPEAHLTQQEIENAISEYKLSPLEKRSLMMTRFGDVGFNEFNKYIDYTKGAIRTLFGFNLDDRSTAQYLSQNAESINTLITAAVAKNEGREFSLDGITSNVFIDAGDGTASLDSSSISELEKATIPYDFEKNSRIFGSTAIIDGKRVETGEYYSSVDAPGWMEDPLLGTLVSGGESNPNKYYSAATSGWIYRSPESPEWFYNFNTENWMYPHLGEEGQGLLFYAHSSEPNGGEWLAPKLDGSGSYYDFDDKVYRTTEEVKNMIANPDSGNATSDSGDLSGSDASDAAYEEYVRTNPDLLEYYNSNKEWDYDKDGVMDSAQDVSMAEFGRVHWREFGNAEGRVLPSGSPYAWGDGARPSNIGGTFDTRRRGNLYITEATFADGTEKVFSGQNRDEVEREAKIWLGLIDPREDLINPLPTGGGKELIDNRVPSRISYDTGGNFAGHDVANKLANAKRQLDDVARELAYEGFDNGYIQGFLSQTEIYKDFMDFFGEGENKTEARNLIDGLVKQVADKHALDENMAKSLDMFDAGGAGMLDPRMSLEEKLAIRNAKPSRPATQYDVDQGLATYVGELIRNPEYDPALSYYFEWENPDTGELETKAYRPDMPGKHDFMALQEDIIHGGKKVLNQHIDDIVNPIDDEGNSKLDLAFKKQRDSLQAKGIMAGGVDDISTPDVDESLGLYANEGAAALNYVYGDDESSLEGKMGDYYDMQNHLRDQSNFLKRMDTKRDLDTSAKIRAAIDDLDPVERARDRSADRIRMARFGGEVNADMGGIRQKGGLYESSLDPELEFKNLDKVTGLGDTYTYGELDTAGLSGGLVNLPQMTETMKVGNQYSGNVIQPKKTMRIANDQTGEERQRR